MTLPSWWRATCARKSRKSPTEEGVEAPAATPEAGEAAGEGEGE